jgi:Ca2+-binding EF-hand superfamily protein
LGRVRISFARSFDATDADHDGTLSEASTCRVSPAAWHAQLESETTAQMKQTDVRFDALDADKNGTISQASSMQRAKDLAGGERIAERGKAERQ